MKSLYKLFKIELLFICLIAVLFFWSFCSSILAFQNKAHIVLIGKTSEGFKIISEKETDPIETLQFIRHFISLTLNFDETSYVEHISLAGDLMTERLWNIKEPEFKQMAGFIKKHKVIQSTEILKVKKIKANKYEVEINNYLFKNGNLTEKTKSVFLSLTDNKRSVENPWGYSVSDVEIK